MRCSPTVALPTHHPALTAGGASGGVQGPPMNQTTASFHTHRKGSVLQQVQLRRLFGQPSKCLGIRLQKLRVALSQAVGVEAAAH